MTIYLIPEGEICVLAAVCVMGNLVYDFSVEAEEDTTLAVIPPDVFRELLTKDETFKEYVFNTLANKLIVSLNTMEMLNFTGIEERILQYLQDHADENGRVKTTHEKIAVDLGSTREVITRQIKKLANKGIVIQRRGSILFNQNTL